MASIANPFAMLGDDSDDEGSSSRTSATKTTKKKAVSKDSRSKNKSNKQNNNQNQRGGKNVGTTRKREKDRHVSGTGRGKGSSKGGKGKFGVGDERDELKGNDDADAELNQDEAAEPEEPKEPEVPTISYDEFMATQNNKKASYKSFAVIEKKDEDGAIFERSKVKKVRKKKVKEVKTLALNFKYADKEKSSNVGAQARAPNE